MSKPPTWYEVAIKEIQDRDEEALEEELNWLYWDESINWDEDEKDEDV